MMNLDELEASLKGGESVEEEEEEEASSIDFEDEAWEMLELLEEVQPVLKALVQRNRQTPFLPKKQKKELEQAFMDISEYLCGWSTTGESK
jgi:hypothetical protein